MWSLTTISLMLPWIMSFFLGSIGNTVASNACSNCSRGNKTDCQFYRTLCEWESEEWKSASEYYEQEVKLDTAKYDTGTMRSPWICSTHGAPHCLTFDYSFVSQKRPKVTLTLLLEVRDTGSVPVWQLTDTKYGVFTGEAPIRTTADFRMVFKVNRPSGYEPGVGSFVKILKIVYKEQESTVFPPEAAIHTTTPIFTTTPILTTTPSVPAKLTERESVAMDEGALPSDDVSDDDDPSSSLSTTTAIIISAVTAVVVTAVVLAVFLAITKFCRILWFKRPVQRDTTQRFEEINMVAAPKAPGNVPAEDIDNYIIID